MNTVFLKIIADLCTHIFKKNEASICLLPQKFRYSRMKKKAQDILDKYRAAADTEQIDFVKESGYGPATIVMHIQRPNKVKLCCDNKDSRIIFVDMSKLNYKTSPKLQETYKRAGSRRFPVPIFLACDKIDLHHDFSVKDFKKSDDGFTLNICDKDGNQDILTFDNEYNLKHYRLIDCNHISGSWANNKNYSCKISNTKKNVKFKEDEFERPASHDILKALNS